MTTKCYFDSDDFVARNGSSVIVSSESGSHYGSVLVSIIDREGKVEDCFVIKGDELICAVQNCMHTAGGWEKF